AREAARGRGRVKRRIARESRTASALGKLLVLALAACEGRPQSASSQTKEPRSGPKVVVLDFTQGVPELEESSFLGGTSHKRTHQVLLHRLSVIRKENDVRSIFIRLGSADIPLARAQEIGESLESIRKETKITIGCHADGLSNSTAYLFARG